MMAGKSYNSTGSKPGYFVSRRSKKKRRFSIAAQGKEVLRLNSEFTTTAETQKQSRDNGHDETGAAPAENPETLEGTQKAGA